MSHSNFTNGPQASVGAVVFKDNRILLVKRGNQPNKDTWTIPGGKIKSGETLQEAAEREIFEETGIVIRAEEPIFVFDYIEKTKSGNIKFHYVIIDLAGEYVSGELKPGDDAADTGWITAEDLGTMGVNLRIRKLLMEKFGFGSKG